jgi:hypothetical protein
MLRKGILALMFAGALLVTGSSAQDIRVNIAPPRARYERRPPAPGRGYVWTPGYYRWDGRGYNWDRGAWVRPPRAHARWIAPHWRRHGHRWVFVEGRWR